MRNIETFSIKNMQLYLFLVKKTSQKLRMLSRSLPDYKSLLLNVMIQVSQFVSNSQLCQLCGVTKSLKIKTSVLAGLGGWVGKLATLQILDGRRNLVWSNGSLTHKGNFSSVQSEFFVLCDEKRP